MPPVPPPPQFSPLCSALSAWDGYLTICKVDMNGLFFFHLSFSSLGLSEGRSGRHTDGSNGRKDDSEGDILSPNAPLIIQSNPKATVQKKKSKPRIFCSCHWRGGRFKEKRATLAAEKPRGDDDNILLSWPVGSTIQSLRIYIKCFSAWRADNKPNFNAVAAVP